MKNFTCFGEVLWDVFPNHKKIGGAPLNVALRLKSFGNDVNIISSVGKDDLGNKLINFLNENNLDSIFIQTDDLLQTGKVSVTLDSNGSASYEINQPVAWDNIQLNNQIIEYVAKSDVFVFGSLVCRNLVSRQTLFELLKVANFKVFDVNLREPFYTFELLTELMQKADFIKFNDEELELISEELNSGYSTIEENMSFISEKFNASHICVTRGSKGAVLLINKSFYFNEGYIIKVKDTVGAGDSFLASLLHKIINNFNPQEAINYACAVGSLVASSEGANPKLLESDIIKKMSSN